MPSYTATLTGEINGHVEQRNFGTQANAVAWCEGEGLAKFDDQTALGVVYADAQMVWRKSGLGREQQDMNRAMRRFLAKNRPEKPG